MKIFSAEQIHSWDEATLNEQRISALELMERAAFTCVNWLVENSMLSQNIHIFCGPGNNGGDGLAMARILLNAGAKIYVHLLEGRYSEMNLQNQNLLKDFLSINVIGGESSLPVLHPGDLVIEALFGTGLKSKPRGKFEELIKHINASGTRVISIDIPAGMGADTISDTAITARHTLTFQSPKFSFFLPESEKFLGELHVLDIGLSRNFLQTEPSRFYLTEEQEMCSLVIPRRKFSHKGDYGHAAMVAGSRGMMGAAVLAAKACLRSGAGKLTCYVPKKGLNIIQTAVPAAMASARRKSRKYLPEFKATHSVIGFGPGIGRNKNEKELCEFLFRQNSPLIIDADGLNAIAANRKLLKDLPRETILTPHPGEFDRLFGTVSNRVKAATEYSAHYKIYIILKGRYTCVATPEGRGFFNPTGNPGMARGGMGDVLTGILAGLRSQQYSSFDACRLGVYLHGLSGDLAVLQQSEQSLQPEDLINCLGEAWKKVSRITQVQ